MSLHFCAVPALQPEPAQCELNAFLAQGLVVDAACRTSPGCSVVTAQPAASHHVV